ncbi:MAG: hypothetical protein ACOCRK_02530 [bacterium]
MTQKIPEGIKNSLDRYVNERVPVGGFLQAVLSNDLMGAMGKADEQNREALHSICSYVYNNIPLACWGSKEKVKKWLNDT